MDYLETLFNVQDKVAVITGGSGILGTEMADGLLNAGAKVVLLARNEKKIKQKVESLSKSGEVIGLKCDVLDEDNINRASEEILNKFKHIDVLINAAGGNLPGATIGLNQNIFDLKIDEFRKVTDLNLDGTVLPSLIFGKTMVEQKKGSIINISSMVAIRAISRVVGYSAAKAAVDNFTRWLAVEMALKFGSGIRVNAIAPGFFLTEQNKHILTNEDGSLSERGKTIINITPFKRFGNPDELNGTVLWLASDASQFVTGTIVPVDGGFNIYGGV